MYGNILLSTDGSDVAKKGVKHGIAPAKALNAKVAVITVTEPLPVDYGSGHAAGWIPSQQEADSFDAARKERAGKVLDDRRDRRLVWPQRARHVAASLHRDSSSGDGR